MWISGVFREKLLKDIFQILYVYVEKKKEIEPVGRFLKVELIYINLTRNGMSSFIKLPFM